MASVHFWTEARESFIAPTYCGVEAIKLSGRAIYNNVLYTDYQILYHYQFVNFWNSKIFVKYL